MEQWEYFSIQTGGQYNKFKTEITPDPTDDKAAGGQGIRKIVKFKTNEIGVYNPDEPKTFPQK